MARCRMVSKEISFDYKMSLLSLEAEFLYLKAIPHLDRDGLISGDPVVLWSTIAPKRLELLDKMPALISEWVNVGLVVRYAWVEGHVLFFTGFRKHNANMEYEKEGVSRFPAPPHWERTPAGLLPQDIELAQRLISTMHPSSKYRKVLEKALKPKPAPRKKSDEVEPDNLTNTLSPSNRRVIAELLGNNSRDLSDQYQTKHQDQNQHQDQNDDDVEHHHHPRAQRTQLAPAIHNNTDDDDKRLIAMQALALDIAADCTEWLGAEKVIITEFKTTQQLKNALTWLWLWDLYDNQPRNDAYAQFEIQSRYTKDPFRGAENHIGVMITQIRRSARAPLHPTDQVALENAIEDRILHPQQ